MKIFVMRFSTVILIIVTIFWGILLGGMMYSHIVYFPAYLSDLPKSAVLANGPYGLNDGIFWIIIHPLTLVSLLIALFANRKNKQRRKLIVLPLIVYVIALIITSVYFVPELMRFKDSPSSGIPASEWLSRSKNWMMFSIIRGIGMFAAIIPLFIALTRPQEETIVPPANQ